MKTIFSEEELSIMEALEVKGGRRDVYNQDGCNGHCGCVKAQR